MLSLFVAAALATTWQQPPPEILEVLHAPATPSMWTSPDAQTALLMTPVKYPPLADRAAAMLPLAGIRVDARTGGFHGRSGYTGPTILDIESGESHPVELGGARVLGVDWSPSGERLALTLLQEDHIGLWVGTADGAGQVLPDVRVMPLMGPTVHWLSDRDELVVQLVPDRGAPPERSLTPAGPMVRSGDGDSAISTYEARDLLRDAHDEALFTWYTTSQLAVLDVVSGEVERIGKPAVYADASPSPDGRFLLVERMEPPWSQRHAWWRFASDVEVWTLDGRVVSTIAELPMHDSVPIHGVSEGPRGVSWRSSAPSTLLWVEALDGGDWSTEVPHRDRLMMAAAPFRKAPRQVFLSEHRVRRWWWGERRGALIVEQYERARRWRHVWQVDVDKRRGQRPVAARRRALLHGTWFQQPGRPSLPRQASSRVRHR